MKNLLVSVTAASLVVVNAFAKDIDSEAMPNKVPRYNIEQVESNTMADVKKMGKNVLFTSGNLLMEVSSDLLVDAGFQSVKTAGELFACASNTLALSEDEKEYGAEITSPFLKDVQKAVNGRQKTSAITGLIASTLGCTIDAANSSARLLAINTGDRMVDLVAIPGTLGHDVKVISYKNAGDIAKIAIRTHNKKGEEVGLQLDVRVVAAVRSMPELAIAAAGGALELADIGVQAGNDGLKVLVNGVSSGITFAKEASLVIIDIPVVRATSLVENALKAAYHGVGAALNLVGFAITGSEDMADAYVECRIEASKQVFYSIGTLIGGRTASEIDADIEKALNEERN